MSLLKVNDVQDTGGSSLIGRKNVIINGDFDVWQRGTFFNSAVYTADRWYNNAATASDISRVAFTLGQTAVPNNPKYFYRAAVTSTFTSNTYSNQLQKIEGADTFAGETVTLSFWAKADAVKNIATEFVQNFGSGGSPSTEVNTIGVTTHALTTGWTKYTVTATLPSISGKTLGTNGDDCLVVIFWLDAGSNFNARTNSLGNQSGTFDIAQVQLEKGSGATQFEHLSYGEELALCQRYYQQVNASVVNTPFAVAVIESSTAVRGCIHLPQVMRTLPAISNTVASGFKVFTTTGTTLTALSFIGNSDRTLYINGTTAGGLTAGQAAQFLSVDGTAKIFIDAEL